MTIRDDRENVYPGHRRNLAPCFFSSRFLISAITFSTSESVRVRSGLRKVKVKAMLLRPSPAWSPAVLVERAHGLQRIAPGVLDGAVKIAGRNVHVDHDRDVALDGRDSEAARWPCARRALR